MFQGHTASSVIFTARKRSLGQGNIFAPVCHSVHRGVGLPQYMLEYHHPPSRDQAHPAPETGTHPRADTALEQTPPSPTPDQTCPQRRHPPPSAVHAGRYGQQAGGMHPTGMQSCMLCKFLFVFYSTNGIPNNSKSFVHHSNSQDIMLHPVGLKYANLGCTAPLSLLPPNPQLTHCYLWGNFKTKCRELIPWTQHFSRGIVEL